MTEHDSRYYLSWRRISYRDLRLLRYSLFKSRFLISNGCLNISTQDQNILTDFQHVNFWINFRNWSSLNRYIQLMCYESGILEVNNFITPSLWFKSYVSELLQIILIHLWNKESTLVKPPLWCSGDSVPLNYYPEVGLPWSWTLMLSMMTDNFHAWGSCFSTCSIIGHSSLRFLQCIMSNVQYTKKR